MMMRTFLLLIICFVSLYSVAQEIPGDAERVIARFE